MRPLLLTDDFAWENFLPAHVPFGGRYGGAAALEAYLQQFGANWIIGELVFRDFIFDPEAKILAARGVEKNGKAIQTNRVCDMPFIWAFRFSDKGNLSYVREYNDTASIGGTFDV